MIGFLIDGQWFAPGAVECVQYLKRQGNAWFPCTGLKEWNEAPEDQRAIRIRTAGGGDVLIERPKSVERKDLFALMVETKPAAAPAPGEQPAAPGGGAADPKVVEALRMGDGKSATLP